MSERAGHSDRGHSDTRVRKSRSERAPSSYSVPTGEPLCRGCPGCLAKRLRQFADMLATATSAAACGFLLATRGVHGMHATMAQATGSPRVSAHLHAGEPAVSLAICTGTSCDSRCSFNSVLAFEGLSSADSDAVRVTERNCMNMCKRGPAVRVVADGLVASVEQRMNKLEQERSAFHNVASLARVEAVYGVAAAIADGSRRDAYGEFSVTSHGPLPPSAL
jgi:hypothetical protein